MFIFKHHLPREQLDSIEFQTDLAKLKSILCIAARQDNDGKIGIDPMHLTLGAYLEIDRENCCVKFPMPEWLVASIEHGEKRPFFNFYFSSVEETIEELHTKLTEDEGIKPWLADFETGGKPGQLMSYPLPPGITFAEMSRETFGREIVCVGFHEGPNETIWGKHLWSCDFENIVGISNQPRIYTARVPEWFDQNYYTLVFHRDYQDYRPRQEFIADTVKQYQGHKFSDIFPEVQFDGNGEPFEKWTKLQRPN